MRLARSGCERDSARNGSQASSRLPNCSVAALRTAVRDLERHTCRAARRATAPQRAAGSWTRRPARPRSPSGSAESPAGDHGAGAIAQRATPPARSREHGDLRARRIEPVRPVEPPAGLNERGSTSGMAPSTTSTIGAARSPPRRPTSARPDDHHERRRLPARRQDERRTGPPSRDQAGSSCQKKLGTARGRFTTGASHSSHARLRVVHVPGELATIDADDARRRSTVT